MPQDLYESEILTRTTPRERLAAFQEMMARNENWPQGSPNAARIQAKILRDLVDMALNNGLSMDLDQQD